MVQTRRQYRDWVEDRGPRYHSQEDDQEEEVCESCMSQDNNDSMDGPSYGNRDNCKRHRKPDNDPYSETVVSYRRRKPKQ
jgi:hypothetical protein